MAHRLLGLSPMDSNDDFTPPAGRTTQKPRARRAKAALAETPAVAAPRQKRHPRPTIEQITARAYALFVARGGVHGADVSDWLEAERQLTSAPKPSQRTPRRTRPALRNDYDGRF